MHRSSSSSFLSECVNQYDNDLVEPMGLNNYRAKQVFYYANSLDRSLCDVFEKVHQCEALLHAVEALVSQHATDELSTDHAVDSLDIFLPMSVLDAPCLHLHSGGAVGKCSCMGCFDDVSETASRDDQSLHGVSQDNENNLVLEDRRMLDELSGQIIMLHDHRRSLWGMINFIKELAQQANVFLPSLILMPKSMLTFDQSCSKDSGSRLRRSSFFIDPDETYGNPGFRRRRSSQLEEGDAPKERGGSIVVNRPSKLYTNLNRHPGPSQDSQFAVQTAPAGKHVASGVFSDANCEKLIDGNGIVRPSTPALESIQHSI
tara:strand:+ start:6084 stop:7034 length:951 start_codon:yes stop_codon:yes gene_type:complete